MRQTDNKTDKTRHGKTKTGSREHAELRVAAQRWVGAGWKEEEKTGRDMEATRRQQRGGITSTQQILDTINFELVFVFIITSVL
jgi:hypothetical protein